MSKPDVHTRHCCKYHGCKYDDPHCSVFEGPKEAEYSCRECIDEPSKVTEYLDFVYTYCSRLERENKLPREYRNLYNELLALKLKL